MLEQNYIHGLPRRMGVALSAMRARNEEPRAASGVVWQIQNDVKSVPLDVTGEVLKAQILNLSEACARQCHDYVWRYSEKYKMAGLIIEGIALLCRQMNVNQPLGETAQEIIARATSAAWWARQLRTEHKRRLEHTSIQLGFTDKRRDPYISREAALLQAQYNRENQTLLESVTLLNEQTGQEFSVADLAKKGMADKANRRNELMTRIRGFEEIAQELKHVGMFWTITCPSEFHSVGGTNPSYSGKTPREAQAYLVQVWALIRARLHRQGIRPYGFRIAEPHTDGCPHWHMLLFVNPAHALRMQRIITVYARAWHPHEKGAKENRIKLVRIEAGKGTAAGYIAKYVSKNIDGTGVGDHKSFEDGRTYVVSTDMFGNEEITPSQRVTYWSQVWGIRQFQQIGGAPVGVWRELRRITAETIAKAPEPIKAAWQAVQKVESVEAQVAKQADWAAYVRAQGGVDCGRATRVRIAKRLTTVEGRYGTYEEEKPCGVFSADQPKAVYESVRYTWTVKGEADEPPKPKGGFASPWTGVNNCTDFDFRAISRRMDKATKDLAEGVKNKKFAPQMVGGWKEINESGKEEQKKSEKFVWRSNQQSKVAPWQGEKRESKLVLGWDFGRQYDKEGRLI